MMRCLRPANFGDAAEIARIWYRGWLDAHLGNVPDALLAYRQPEGFALRAELRVPLTTVATIDSQVVGFVVVHENEIEQIYVDESARGAGVANALIAHAEQEIARRFETGWLAVVAGNERARRFYARNGWRDAGAFDYVAEAGEGTILVPCRRYEKDFGA